MERDSSDLQSFTSAKERREFDVDDLRPPTKAELTPESNKLKQTLSRWRSEIMGPGHVAWKREELECAVTSTCIMERAVLADVPAEAALVRSRSEDVVMEVRLRRRWATQR